MKFSRDQQSALTIRRVQPGLLQLGSKAFDTDIAVTADGQAETFEIPEIADLREEHLQALLGSEPEMLIIGTGWQAQFAPRELVFALARRGIGVEIMDTPAACRTFNVLISDGRRLAAIIKIC